MEGDEDDENSYVTRKDDSDEEDDDSEDETLKAITHARAATHNQREVAPAVIIPPAVVQCDVPPATIIAAEVPNPPGHGTGVRA